LSRAFVELLGDGVEVGLCQRLEVQSSGEVLAQQTVGVLVAATLPGAVLELTKIVDTGSLDH
jgi:hypothetical protein